MKTYRIQSIAAGILFITATAATMASQMIVEPMLNAPDVAVQIAQQRNAFTIGALLELTNALASAGIAFALYPIIRRCAEGLSVAYLGLRILEASIGLFAACALFTLLSPIDPAIGLSLHEWGFLLVLIVFSIGTLIFYPLLYRYRLVPAFLSLWGIVGGVALLLSCILILFGRIETGSSTDLVLSLPIWINEMALALWLIFRGVDASGFSAMEE